MAAQQQLYGAVAVLLAAALWGTTGTAAAMAPEVGAVAIGAAAMGGGGLLQALWAARPLHRARADLWRQWRWLLLGAAMVAVYPLAFYGSMRLAGITIGTVVTIGSAPVFSALLEYVFDGLRLTLRWLAGALLGVIGMILLCVAESGHDGQAVSVVWGVVLGLGAGLSYALYSWVARRLMQTGIAARAAMGALFGAGALMLLPVLWVSGTPLLASWNNALVGLYMALVPMFLGYVCFGFGLARVRASTAITLTLFEPVVAAMLAMVWVGERLPLLGWVGIALVMACLVCLTVPLPPRWRKSAAAQAEVL
ncbi:DME family drug/metabolite transporter [Neisseria sp. HSC-16F19]|nr:EamA family transporter [Neisseria sp. HSC-16F19]MCP2040109.1 DME family drug/metabolite transporter [Neisseria sp. HSC-16F19]